VCVQLALDTVHSHRVPLQPSTHAHLMSVAVAISRVHGESALGGHVSCPALCVVDVDGVVVPDPDPSCRDACHDTLLRLDAVGQAVLRVVEESPSASDMRFRLQRRLVSLDRLLYLHVGKSTYATKGWGGGWIGADEERSFNNHGLLHIGILGGEIVVSLQNLYHLRGHVLNIDFTIVKATARLYGDAGTVVDLSTVVDALASASDVAKRMASAADTVTGRIYDALNALENRVDAVFDAVMQQGLDAFLAVAERAVGIVDGLVAPAQAVAALFQQLDVAMMQPGAIDAVLPAVRELIATVQGVVTVATDALDSAVVRTTATLETAVEAAAGLAAVGARGLHEASDVAVSSLSRVKQGLRHLDAVVAVAKSAAVSLTDLTVLQSRATGAVTTATTFVNTVSDVAAMATLESIAAVDDGLRNVTRVLDEKAASADRVLTALHQLMSAGVDVLENEEQRTLSLTIAAEMRAQLNVTLTLLRQVKAGVGSVADVANAILGMDPAVSTFLADACRPTTTSGRAFNATVSAVADAARVLAVPIAGVVTDGVADAHAAITAAIALLDDIVTGLNGTAAAALNKLDSGIEVLQRELARAQNSTLWNVVPTAAAAATTLGTRYLDLLENGTARAVVAVARQAAAGVAGLSTIASSLSDSLLADVEGQLAQLQGAWTAVAARDSKLRVALGVATEIASFFPADVGAASNVMRDARSVLAALQSPAPLQSLIDGVRQLRQLLSSLADGSIVRSGVAQLERRVIADIGSVVSRLRDELRNVQLLGERVKGLTSTSMAAAFSAQRGLQRRAAASIAALRVGATGELQRVRDALVASRLFLNTSVVARTTSALNDGVARVRGLTSACNTLTGLAGIQIVPEAARTGARRVASIADDILRTETAALALDVQLSVFVTAVNVTVFRGVCVPCLRQSADGFQAALSAARQSVSGARAFLENVPAVGTTAVMTARDAAAQFTRDVAAAAYTVSANVSSSIAGLLRDATAVVNAAPVVDVVGQAIDGAQVELQRIDSIAAGVEQLRSGADAALGKLNRVRDFARAVATVKPSTLSDVLAAFDAVADYNKVVQRIRSSLQPFRSVDAAVKRLADRTFSSSASAVASALRVVSGPISAVKDGFERVRRQLAAFRSKFTQLMRVKDRNDVSLPPLSHCDDPSDASVGVCVHAVQRTPSFMRKIFPLEVRCRGVCCGSACCPRRVPVLCS
jgi:hypothetical protein